jgi:glycerophosphoryl diester phosphodiesterase
LEFDLHMTSDNVPVVMHDDTVDRTTNGTGRIRDLTARQIGTLDAGSSYSPAFAGVGVPTFEQIVKFASHAQVIILPELKDSGWTAHQVTIVTDLIHHYGMADMTMFQSFHPEVLQLAASIAPDIARAGLVSEIPADPVEFVQRFGGQGLLPKAAAVTARTVATLHRAGLSVMVWTVDDPTDWQRLTSFGVDGIMTNNPGALAGWVQRYRQEH